MSRLTAVAGAVGVLGVFSCTATPPDGVFACFDSWDCPEGQSCYDARCSRRNPSALAPDGATSTSTPGPESSETADSVQSMSRTDGAANASSAGAASAAIRAGAGSVGGAGSAGSAGSGAGGRAAAQVSAGATAAAASCRCSTLDACCNGCEPQHEGGACTSDDVDCTNDICRAGTCAHEPKLDHCMIDGKCIADGTQNPTQSCQVCNAAKDRTKWSDQPEKTPCDDGLYCNGADHCGGAADGASGRCIHGSSDPCVVGPDDCKVCDEATDQCVFRSDKTWTDPATNLQWSRAYTSGGYQEIVSHCQQWTFCGRSDWHLATISEIRTLIRNCPATQLGGTCRVTDTCLTDSCNSAVCTDGCLDKNDNTGRDYLADEVMDPRGMVSSSSRSPAGGPYMTSSFAGNVIGSSADIGEHKGFCVTKTP